MFDATTEQCFYLHSSAWSGMARPRLRLEKPANGQVDGIRWATEHTLPELPTGSQGHSEAVAPIAMLRDPAPE